MGVAIDSNLCPQNHVCPMIKICPVGAISQDGFKLPMVDETKCIECGKCVKGCGMKAMSIHR